MGLTPPPYPPWLTALICAMLSGTILGAVYLVTSAWLKRGIVEQGRIKSVDSLEVELKYFTKVRKPSGYERGKPYWERVEK